MRNIVSLTSFGKRITSTLPQTLDSINKQIDFKPDCILLYLAESDYKLLNKNVLSRFDCLDIRVVSDYRSFKKYYALADREFDNDLIWIIDDDLYYRDFNYSAFKGTYDKYKNRDAVYAFNAWQVKDFNENFYENKIVKSGLLKGKFIIGSDKFFPPNVMRINEPFIQNAFEFSPTCDDTFISPYLMHEKIDVYKIKLPDNEDKNYNQLDIPSNTIKLIDINRHLLKSNLKKNFDYFGLL